MGPTPDPDAEAARASSEIHRVLGRSLHLRHLDAGSCNACDWELAALLNPVYDVRRLGIDFVASPRHADGVMVTGPVTRNLQTAVRRTVEAIPDPRIVIAVGACAASGGIVGEGYASAGGVDRVLPVDVYIPGCPPRPEAILFGILVALGRLDARRASAAGRRPWSAREGAARRRMGGAQRPPSANSRSSLGVTLQDRNGTMTTVPVRFDDDEYRCARPILRRCDNGFVRFDGDGYRCAPPILR